MTQHKPLDFAEMQPQTRLRELILHIADSCLGDSTFGKVKLAKILYFADFTSFRLYGKPVTGATYIKLPRGPVPQDFFEQLETMETNGDIFLRIEPYYTYEQHRIIPKRVADLTLFSGRDIGLVDKIINDIKGKSAQYVSELSHALAWRVVEMNAPIPYEAALLSDEEVTEEDVESANALITEDGWDEWQI
jgi:hypothetical protein